MDSGDERTFGTMRVGEGALPYALVVFSFVIALFAFFVSPMMSGG